MPLEGEQLLQAHPLVEFVDEQIRDLIDVIFQIEALAALLGILHHIYGRNRRIRIVEQLRQLLLLLLLEQRVPQIWIFIIIVVLEFSNAADRLRSASDFAAAGGGIAAVEDDRHARIIIVAAGDFVSVMVVEYVVDFGGDGGDGEALLLGEKRERCEHEARSQGVGFAPQRHAFGSAHASHH